MWKIAAEQKCRAFVYEEGPRVDDDHIALNRNGIAAIDRRTRRNGAVIEELGWYDPIAKDPAKQIQLNEERVKYWVSKGAQPSDTVRDMLGRRGLINVEKWEKDREYDRTMIEKKKAEAAAAATAAAEKKEEKKA